MQVSTTLKCPECGAEDTTNIDVEEFDTYVTTQCVECTNPYAIRVEVSITSAAYRLIKAD